MERILTIKPSSLTEPQMDKVNRLASLGFEQTEAEMYQDTKNHVLGSEQIQLGYVDEELKGFALYSSCIGGLAIELVGIVVEPQYQGRGFGGRLLAHYVDNNQPDYLTAYTRNPYTVGILNQYNGTFPVNSSEKLKSIAGDMEGSELIDGVAYHIGRYGQNGLYGANDPAGRCLRGDDIALKERFSKLSDPGSALVLAAKVD